MFFDSHVHLDDFAEDGTLSEILARSEQERVLHWLAVGGSPGANELAVRMARSHPNRIVAAVGVDRSLAEDPRAGLASMHEWARSPEVVAIGETGLDYFYTPEHAPQQRELFARCLALAHDVKKPVVVHTRDADEDTVAALKEFVDGWKGDPSAPGVIHCFTRDRRTAARLLDLGFYISFSGIVTFANAIDLRETAAWVPEDRLLIETDSPYLAPIPYRGRRCEPSFLPATARLLAEIRECTADRLGQVTAANARRLFGLDNPAPAGQDDGSQNAGIQGEMG